MKTEKIDQSVIQDEQFYYYRNLKNNYPIITVCLLKTAEGFCRGLSIVGATEKPQEISKAKGRKIAKGRAIKALFRKKTSLRISRDEANEMVNKTKCPFYNKSHFDAK